MDPRGDDDRGITLHDAKDDGAGCLLAYSADTCIATSKVQPQGGHLFYWEHVRTGYELFLGKSSGDFLLMVYAPTQVTSAPLPPEKTTLGHPLDPKAEAMTCLYQ
jgi:hypothetical protein